MGKKSTKANNVQNIEELSDKNENAEAREPPCCWKSLPEIINIAELLELAKSYAHLFVEVGLLDSFVVDKRTRIICCSTKGTVVKSLGSLVVKPLK